MLQTVLGLDAATIATAFLVPPQAMAKHLVRAKAKIKATGIRFEEPERAEADAAGQLAEEAQAGPYPIEAAIQAAHMEGLAAGAVPWAALEHLFQHLVAMAPTSGARIGHAIAAAYAANAPARGLTLLAEISQEQAIGHQPWWTVRARLCAWAGQSADAAEAYDRAMALTRDPTVRDWLGQRRATPTA